MACWGRGNPQWFCVYTSPMVLYLHFNLQSNHVGVSGAEIYKKESSDFLVGMLLYCHGSFCASHARI